MIAHGFSNYQFDVYSEARALEMLLTDIPKYTQELKTKIEKEAMSITEYEDVYDEDAKKYITIPWHPTYDTQIFDDMQRTFILSLIPRIYSFCETKLRELAINKKNPTKKEKNGMSDIFGYYSRLEHEYKVVLPPLTSIWTQYESFHKIRIQLTHYDIANPIQNISYEYIRQNIEQVEQLLLNTDRIIKPKPSKQL